MPEHSTSMLHVRVDDTIKQQASEALDQMGLTLSEAVRVLLARIANDRVFPFQLRAPNAAESGSHAGGQCHDACALRER